VTMASDGILVEISKKGKVQASFVHASFTCSHRVNSRGPDPMIEPTRRVVRLLLSMQYISMHVENSEIMNHLRLSTNSLLLK